MVGGWELSWVVIDMDPKANLYNTLSDSNTYEAIGGHPYLEAPQIVFSQEF